MASILRQGYGGSEGRGFYVNGEDLMRLTNMLEYMKADVGGRARGLSAGRVTRTSLARAGRYIAKISKQNLRSRNKVRTGNLLSSSKVKVKKNNEGVLIGFAHPKGNHAHLVDLGHELVVGPKRKHTGKRTKPSLFHSDAREHLPGAAAVFVATFEREMLKQAQYWSTR